MSINLSLLEIQKKILNDKKILISKDKLLKYLEFTEDNFYKYSKLVKDANNNIDETNPLLWQYGHVIFFYINLILRNLNNLEYDFNKYKGFIEFYDSHKTPLENRNSKNILDFNTCIDLYQLIMIILKNYLKKNEIGVLESYLIMLGILHNEMHNEAFIFTLFSYKIKVNYPLIEYKYNEYLIRDISFIDYCKGSFIQGSDELTNKLVFDNEMPSFKKDVEKFSISKYPITESMYLEFVKNNGYTTRKYWCRNGHLWLKKNNITLPKYWIKKNNVYFKEINNECYFVETNLPMSNISYYEACAYCKFKNVRLPTETEYEYCATNMGTTLYPWGNREPDNNLCNINYNKNLVSVTEYKNGNNKKSVSQLIGNIWEWCLEPIYPYDGFKIDPVYREMSYPFFGFKKICKGGCFAVPDFLIHPKYRNAQYPDCRIQFIGFRVCKI